jgi:hypothetical protein
LAYEAYIHNHADEAAYEFKLVVFFCRYSQHQ